MISIRRRFGGWITRVAGGFGPAEVRLAAGTTPLQTANLAWAVIFGLVLALSAAILFWSPTAIVAEISIAALWGAFTGITMLFFFPPKLLITLVGGLVGVGVSDFGGMADVIERTAEVIKRIVLSLNSAFENELTLHPISAWLFLVLIVFCESPRLF